MILLHGSPLQALRRRVVLSLVLFHLLFFGGAILLMPDINTPHKIAIFSSVFILVSPFTGLLWYWAFMVLGREHLYRRIDSDTGRHRWLYYMFVLMGAAYLVLAGVHYLESSCRGGRECLLQGAFGLPPGWVSNLFFVTGFFRTYRYVDQTASPSTAHQ
jgi:hypothetical protein